MILDSLNDAQREAVSAPLGHLLILAGAGSGKTRVLTHRIQWLMTKEHLSPHAILAVTFTNKAANEMRHRIERMSQINIRSLWIGTFHGISHRFLRLHHEAAGLPQSFQILDSDDQLRMVKRVIQALNIDEERFPAKESQWYINAQKENNRLPHQVDITDQHSQMLSMIYQTYQETCQRSGVIDFTDLIMKTCQVLQTHAELREHYQNRFRAILVDEFQDTNTLQYLWLKLFARADTAIMMVGDDDQSIYGWRGAKIENIHRFSEDFPNANIIRLEQNYRSTATILSAANALISQNESRLGKNLWTEDETGEKIGVYAAFNEMDEAFFMVNRIREWRSNHGKLNDIAILYRSNAQSRVIEESLMQFGIPYRVYGGLRYFDRQEIKDALAYLRLVNNANDDAAFGRIINTPTRGIGDRTIDAIRDRAKSHGETLHDALTYLLQTNFFAARAHHALEHFMQLIFNMRAHIRDISLEKQIEYIVKQSGLIEHYQKEKGQKALTRLENLEELVNAAHQFSQEAIMDDLPPLSAFLAYAALESSEEQADTYDDFVQLMTLHAAKGLEFPVVFIAGCEEELFPHYLSMQDAKGTEEERRLCYVGITRAMKKLYLTYAETRRIYGKEKYHRPSRFLSELPETLLDEIRFKTKVQRAQPTNATLTYRPENARFKQGQTVRHKVFGEGVVIDTEGQGDDLKVKVRFKTVGTKFLLASFLS